MSFHEAYRFLLRVSFAKKAAPKHIPFPAYRALLTLPFSCAQASTIQGELNAEKALRKEIQAEKNFLQAKLEAQAREMKVLQEQLYEASKKAASLEKELDEQVGKNERSGMLCGGDKAW